MTDKTAAEMLRELREGLLPGEWEQHAEYAGPRVDGSFIAAVEGRGWHNDGDIRTARGIVALVNSLDEIAALVDAVEDRNVCATDDALDALTAKLREQLKGACDE